MLPYRQAILYDLTVRDGAFVASSAVTNEPLNFSLYSEAKFGARAAAEHFGRLLANHLIELLEPTICEGEEIVVLGTPYRNLPNAARLLAVTVDRFLRIAGFASSYSRIYQDHVGTGVYAKLTAQQRDVRNKRKNRYFDPRRLEGKHIVVVDDVLITGSVQRSIAALLEPVPKASLTMLSLAQLDCEMAKREPQLEFALNHTAVQSLMDITRLMSVEHDFMLVTRTVRYILQADICSLTAFLSSLAPNTIVSLYEAIVDECYDEIYPDATAIVANYRNAL